MKVVRKISAGVTVLALAASLFSMVHAAQMTPAQMKARIQALEKENRVLKAKLNGTITTGVKAAGASSATASPRFTDLDGVSTKPLIDQLSMLGLFNGMGSEFHPYAPISRGEYVAWLHNAYNVIASKEKVLRPASHLPAFYSDVPSTHPAFRYVQALSQAGYTFGYADGTFHPDQPITREEMLGMKVALDLGQPLEPNRSLMDHVWGFGDSKDVEERYTGAVYWDWQISGKHGRNIERAFGKVGMLRPKAPVLRSEAAATLWQLDRYGNYTAEAALARKAK
jgi:hypothetical protein